MRMIRTHPFALAGAGQPDLVTVIGQNVPHMAVLTGTDVYRQATRGF